MGTVNGLVRWQAAGLLTDKEETDLRVYITRLLISDRDNQKRSLYRFPYQQENPEGISIPAGISYFSVNFSSLDEDIRSEEHTSENQSLMRISYAVFCLKQKNK